MGTEIERRFLLRNPDWRPAGVLPVRLDQGRYFFGEDADGTVAYCFGLPVFFLHPYEKAARRLSLPLPLSDAWALTLQSRTFLPELGGVKAVMPRGWMARVRAYDNARFVLDIKGPRAGTTRAEFGEFPLTAEQGAALLAHAPPASRLSKLRYTVSHGGQVWVIDVYGGQKKGYQPTCEIELSSATAAFEKPAWVGEEITHRKTFAPPGP